MGRGAPAVRPHREVPPAAALAVVAWGLAPTLVLLTPINRGGSREDPLTKPCAPEGSPLMARKGWGLTELAGSSSPCLIGRARQSFGLGCSINRAISGRLLLATLMDLRLVAETGFRNFRHSEHQICCTPGRSVSRSRQTGCEGCPELASPPPPPPRPCPGTPASAAADPGRCHGRR